jgi:serine/threonine protein kinase
MSRSGLRRFRREREILGRLEHPNIARLVAGGTMEDGRPYLAMEYVDGTPLDVYCEARDLSAREVLELALPVCSALAHAHRNRIVHRDLKPGNVLVTGDGVPKLLDFGIAKLLGPAEEPADATDPRERPMTPHYASPEQVRHEPVTPASDLYSFGVLLYRLLTGRLPCGIDSCTYAEAVRRICEEEPLAPSALAATALPPSFAGDLDAIVFKALRKEPYRRYASMGRLAADIRRCLAGRPVVARRETPGHRGGKRLHRHRFLLTAALAGLAPAALLLLRERKGGSAGRRRTTMPPGKPAAEPDPHTELLAALSLLDHRLGSLERALLRLRMPRPAGDGRIADAEP